MINSDLLTIQNILAIGIMAIVGILIFNWFSPTPAETAQGSTAI